MSVNKVFVYGTLRPGGHFHPLIADHVKECENGRQLAGFTLHMVAGAFFPCISRSVVESDVITGTLLSFEEADMPTVLKVLDRIEGYPQLYTREVVETEGDLAWVYLPAAAKVGDRIPSGDFFNMDTEKETRDNEEN